MFKEDLEDKEQEYFVGIIPWLVRFSCFLWLEGVNGLTGKGEVKLTHYSENHSL